MTIRFVTVTGIEVPAVTAIAMREVDRIAIDETGPNIFQMMENAGRNLALLCIELLGPAWPESRIAVLAGSGGNGGGGICAARHLANRGIDVQLCFASPDRLGTVPAFQRKVFRSTSGREISIKELAREKPSLIVDALIGYGSRVAPGGKWRTSLDVPSGVNATDGRAHAVFIRPRWTMTLALPKTGLLPDRTGALFLADLGIPEGVYRRASISYSIPFGEKAWIQLLTTDDIS
jgi:NAD(P)H-hydrate epimerase